MTAVNEVFEQHLIILTNVKQLNEYPQSVCSIIFVLKSCENSIHKARLECAFCLAQS